MFKKKNFLKFSIQNSSAGFTIMETLVAMFILVVGIGASFSLINQTLATASMAESKLVASYLAQEGIELVKNLRNKAWLDIRSGGSGPWDRYIQEGDWEVDYLSEDLSRSFSDGGAFLYIEEASGFYKYINSPGSNDVKTKFTREISITKIPLGEDEYNLEAKVTIGWQEKGRTHNFEILENITNWYGL